MSGEGMRMPGIKLLEIIGLYAIVLGLGGLIGAAFLVSVALGLLAIGLIGVSLGLGLLLLAAAREAAAQAKGQHTVGGNGALRSAA